MKNFKLPVASLAALAVLAIGGVWLYAQELPTANSGTPQMRQTDSVLPTATGTPTTMGIPLATPSTIVVNTPTSVTVTVAITPPPILNGVNLLGIGANGTQSTVLGVMHDDGMNGDQVAGDNIYSLRLPFNTNAAGSLQLSASAAFQGLLKRVLSPTILLYSYARQPPLPPDPGAAGMIALAGVDSDHDGVRDDVQRYIALTYPGSEKLQSALTQAARALLDKLQDSTNGMLAPIHNLQVLYAADCLDVSMSTPSAQLMANLQSTILNTRDRIAAYVAADNTKTFLTYRLPTSDTQRRARCLVDPTTLPN
jgi:hypothetical protein